MLNTHERFADQYRILIPLLRWPIWQNIHPHAITLAGCLVGIAIWPLLMMHWTGWAIIALLLTGLLDTLDGAVARYLRLTSPQGAALDIFCDRIVEFSILMGLYAVDPATRAIPVLFMLGCILLCITSFLVVGIFSVNEASKGSFYSPGLIERAEAFGFFFLMIFWPTLFKPLAWIFSLLVFLTALIRLWQFFRNSRLVPVRVERRDDETVN
ncbi:MAG: CDP-alcohol phosphatidyltransferase family protein [Chlamydiales bacterium]